MWLGRFQEMWTDVEVTGFTVGCPGGPGGPGEGKGERDV